MSKVRTEKRTKNRTRSYYVVMFILRTGAFLLLAGWALWMPEEFDSWLTAGFTRFTPLTAVWLALMASMLLRFFPSRWESLGCQKIFAPRFRPTGRDPAPEEIRRADRGALRVLLVWAAGNGLVLWAHTRGWLSSRFLVCLAGLYGVGDMVCVLFLCPFQVWMMKNRCCTTCRIYNWDYLMLCTPLLGLEGILSRIACLVAAALFVVWESLYRCRRERFFESGNEALRCAECQEHLCQYKRALAARVKGRGRPREP